MSRQVTRSATRAAHFAPVAAALLAALRSRGSRPATSRVYASSERPTRTRQQLLLVEAVGAPRCGVAPRGAGPGQPAVRADWGSIAGQADSGGRTRPVRRGQPHPASRKRPAGRGQSHPPSRKRPVGRCQPDEASETAGSRARRGDASATPRALRGVWSSPFGPLQRAFAARAGGARGPRAPVSAAPDYSSCARSMSRINGSISSIWYSRPTPTPSHRPRASSVHAPPSIRSRQKGNVRHCVGRAA